MLLVSKLFDFDCFCSLENCYACKTGNVFNSFVVCFVKWDLKLSTVVIEDEIL